MKSHKYEIVGDLICETVGEVVYFNNEKKHGFIRLKGASGKDAFVSWMDIISENKAKKLIEGEKVKFKLFPNNAGLIAKEVVRITDQQYHLSEGIEWKSLKQAFGV